jgi:PH (Pleckstrin Homology) domain-containing protein
VRHNPDMTSATGGTGAATTEPRRVFRSRFAWVTGWLWLALSGGALADLAIRGRDQAAVVVALAVLAIDGVVYLTSLRPAVLADAGGVHLRNPLRDVRAPWPTVTSVDARDALLVRVGEQVYRSWAVQSPNRSRRRALRAQDRAGMSGHPTAPTVAFADLVAGELEGMRTAAIRGREVDSAAALVTVARPALGVAVLAVALAAVAVVLGAA